jgi:hypothetical protein
VATAEPSPEPPSVAELEAEVQELQARNAQIERDLEATSRELARLKRSRSWRATEPLRAAKARLGGRS